MANKFENFRLDGNLLSVDGKGKVWGILRPSLLEAWIFARLEINTLNKTMSIEWERFTRLSTDSKFIRTNFNETEMPKSDGKPIISLTGLMRISNKLCFSPQGQIEYSRDFYKTQTIEGKMEFVTDTNLERVLKVGYVENENGLFDADGVQVSPEDAYKMYKTEDTEEYIYDENGSHVLIDGYTPMYDYFHASITVPAFHPLLKDDMTKRLMGAGEEVVL